jgi:hypothetical protein
MGITLLTAMEIYTNPADLMVSINEHQGKHGFLLGRGPGHYGKIMVECTPYFGTRQETIEYVKDLLTTLCSKVSEDLTKPDSLAAQLINPENKPIEELAGLSPSFIEKIVADLAAGKIAKTFEPT